MSKLRERIQKLPIGYSVVFFKSKKYGVSRSDFNNGRSVKLFAEELGDNDFISLNYYITDQADCLKPCEMPKQKVIDFLNGYQFA
ncbi:peptide methionine sulfoxide reductase [Pseudozobellia sp. WGM2]|uniref:peptide methionine sulfoxide reductase n=1 Tax=Pseudozobellia sp. WGM2 TaxID=2787625 RepID=UPI001ADFEB29|nr:peptide methionine sulfoxide reductase [Pseudozobellia sp. WGM2]